MHPIYVPYDGIERTGTYYVEQPERKPGLIIGVHPKDAQHEPGSNRMMLVLCDGHIGYVFEDWMDPL